MVFSEAVYEFSYIFEVHCFDYLQVFFFNTINLQNTIITTYITYNAGLIVLLT